MNRNAKIRQTAPAARDALPLAGGLLFFICTCLCSAGTVRIMAMVLTMLALSGAFLFWERLRDRMKPPVLALAVMVLLDLVSCFYAVSGKFALNQMLKIAAAFCVALIMLAFTGKDRPERAAAMVLEGFGAVAGLVSIDYMSTRWISTPVMAVVGWFTSDYVDLPAVEEGVRMTSILIYPNTFATCVGVGVLLSLGLAVTSERAGERAVHLVCLSVNALAFVLVFSMGGCVMILPAFLLLLLMTGREERTGMLILMVETLLVTVLAAFPVAATSMTDWTGFRPIPLLCAVAGAAALCALDLLAGRRLAARLAPYGKAVLFLIIGLLAGLALFLAAAFRLTTGVTLQAGEVLRRSAYPEPGDYTLTAQADDGVLVSIQSQNREDAIRHTNSVLYEGPLSQAAFTVPEDSMVVWFEFRAQEEARLDQAAYSGGNGSGSIALGYRLLPGFIANRLQGLWANQNAIQRFAFFEDGLKLFRLSPVIGRGLGAYANGVNGVQSFYYYTYYAHNLFIQAMVDTGLIGLAVLLVLLGVSAVSLWRGRKRPLAPALGAALLFVVLHGSLDGVFSYFATLPMVYGLFAAVGLCCGDAIPLPARAEKKAVRNGAAAAVCALAAASAVLFGLNSAARNMVMESDELSVLEEAAVLDPFEWADYMLTYVVRATGEEVDQETRQKADKYAQRLGRLESNSIPIYLAEYYLETGRPEQGLEMAQRYVLYAAASSGVWQEAFRLLERCEQDTPEYRAGVARIADLMDDWNRENLGYVAVDEQARAFIDRMRG